MSRRIVSLSSVKIGSWPSALAPVGLFIVALAVHAAVWLQYGADPFSSTYVADALSYHEWASRMAERGLAQEPVFHQSPLFPILLSWLYSVTSSAHHAVWSAGFVIVLNCAAIAMLAPIGRAYFGSTVAGQVAGFLALAHGPLVFYGMKLLPGPLGLATQAAGLLALAFARRSGRLRAASLAGFCWGLACLARSEAALFVPCALWALGGSGSPAKRRLARPLAYLAGCALAIAPIALHNVRHGDLVLVASSAGENFFIGNQRGASGGHKPLHPQASDLFSQRSLAEMLAVRAEGRSLRPSEVSRYWRGRALSEIASDPADWIHLELLKLARLLHPGDPTDLYSFALERSHYLPALRALVLTPWALLVLGGAGLAAAFRRRGQDVWPLAAWVGVQVGVLLLFFVDARLRLPVYFFLTPFAGYGVMQGIRLWLGRERRWLVLGVGLAALLGVAIGLLATRAAPRDLVRLASVLSMQSRAEDGLRVLEPELSRPRPDPIAIDTAGWLLHKLGRLEGARDRYVEALAADLPPGRVMQVRTRLAQVYERLGELESAAEQHRAAVASPHANAGTYYERAMFLLRRKDAAAAARDLERAIRLDPGWSPPRQALDSLERERR